MLRAATKPKANMRGPKIIPSYLNPLTTVEYVAEARWLWKCGRVLAKHGQQALAEARFAEARGCMYAAREMRKGERIVRDAERKLGA